MPIAAIRRLEMELGRPRHYIFWLYVIFIWPPFRLAITNVLGNY